MICVYTQNEMAFSVVDSCTYTESKIFQDFDLCVYIKSNVWFCVCTLNQQFDYVYAYTDWWFEWSILCIQTLNAHVNECMHTQNQ